MSYSLDDFIRDTRTSLSGQTGGDGQEEVRQYLERLLRDQTFLDLHRGPDRPIGIRPLHEDAELGFKVLAYVSRPGRIESAPHDHGDSWAIYGQAKSFTAMKDFIRIDPAQPDAVAELRVSRVYRLEPGQAQLYRPGDIHSIHPADDSRYVRLAGSPADAFVPIGPLNEEQVAHAALYKPEVPRP